MIAYKFLRPGGRSRFGPFQWPLPAGGQPGPWVDSGPAVVGHKGVHACTPEQLSFWSGPELWQVELADPVVEADSLVVAGAGRLRCRLEAWNGALVAEYAEACAQRAGGTACAALRHAGHRQRSESVAAAATPEQLAAAAGGAAEVGGRPGQLARYAADAAAFAAIPGMDRSVPYVAAHAAGWAAGVAGSDTYRAAYRAEKAWQSAWLAGRLELGGRPGAIPPEA